MRRAVLQATDERALIDAAAKGDRDAFGRLYERHVSQVYRHIYFLTSDSRLTEDLTAQTFLNALEAIHRYEERGVRFLAWLLRIAYNLAMNHKKLQKNNGHAQLPEGGMEAEGKFYSPEACCEAKLDGERVWHEVRRLRGNERQVIVMRFVDELSYSDIAQVMGKSVGTVRVMQHRALAALRNMLQEYDLGDREPHSRAG